MIPASRYIASAVLAVGLGVGGVTPTQAQTLQSRDQFVRVLVDLADVVLRGNQPYYRYGRHGDGDRLIVRRDRHGRTVYYRLVPAAGRFGNRYPAAYGARKLKCNKHGKCKLEYYDPRYDRDAGRYSRYSRDWDDDDRDRDDDDRRWRRDRDDD